MRHASLFSGIGGFDLAAEWMGWENVFQVEIDKFCTKVLEKNFPNVTRYGDIKEFNGSRYAGHIDVLTGGFPCQSFSVAGKGQVDMSLWKEYDRCIRDIKPRWIVAENVPGIIGRSDGLSIEQVYNDLESQNYSVLPPLVLPAGAVDSPQYRYRVWIVAHSNEVRCDSQKKKPLQSRRPTVELCPRWSVEPEVGRVAYGLPNQLHEGQSLGNAIVPQVAFEFFKAIETINK